MEDAAIYAYTASLVSTERSHISCVDRGHLHKIRCATERIVQVLNPYRRCRSAVQVHPVHLGLDLSRRVQLFQPTGFHSCSTSIQDHSLPCICFSQRAFTGARPRWSLSRGVIVSAAKVCAGLVSASDSLVKLTGCSCLSIANKAPNLSVEGSFHAGLVVVRYVVKLQLPASSVEDGQ